MADLVEELARLIIILITTVQAAEAQEGQEQTEQAQAQLLGVLDMQVILKGQQDIMDQAVVVQEIHQAIQILQQVVTVVQVL
jgi:hypothetical protein